MLKVTTSFITDTKILYVKDYPSYTLGIITKGRYIDKIFIKSEDRVIFLNMEKECPIQWGFIDSLKDITCRHLLPGESITLKEEV